MAQTKISKMSKARTVLLLENPFFGMISLRLKLMEDETCPTAWTDGATLGYNPKWIESPEMTMDKLKGLIAHEVLHVAFMHHLRRGQREPFKWNIACDGAINSNLDKAGFALPEDGISGYGVDETAEEIYNKLPKNPKGKGGKGGNGGMWGEVRDATGEKGKVLTKEEAQIKERDVKIMVTQAAQQAKNRGTLPASIQRMVNEILEPKIDWKQILRLFVEEAARNDYNWTRPNRRYLSQGFYLPELRNHELGKIVIAVDTSGSVGQKALQQFISEVSSVLEEFNTTIYLLPVDAEVHDPQEYTQHDLPLRAHISGGGGTSFIPPFDYVKENDIQPSCFIYLTDGYCDEYPEYVPDYPVMWVYSEQIVKAPFGQILKIDVKGE